MTSTSLLTDRNPVLVLGETFQHADVLAGLEPSVAAASRIARRRTLAFELDKTEPSYRDMVTVGSLDLAKISRDFASAYELVRRGLEMTIGRPVFAVPDVNERYVLNMLDRPYDEQGWHVDTYAYAVNVLLEAPVKGGALAIDLGSRSVALGFPPRSWYALCTDKVRHRVTPLLIGRRVLLNFAFHSRAAGPASSYSSAGLYQPIDSRDDG